MLIDTRTKSRAYRRHQKQGLWKALRFCAFFCLDLASLATLCRGLLKSTGRPRRWALIPTLGSSLFYSYCIAAETVSYEVDIRWGRVNFTGKNVSAITLNDSIPAPTLTAAVGDIFRVKFVNHMDVETSVHWHGVLLPNDQDGVPYLTTQPIAANSEFTYEFPVIHHGTYWYHSHTGLQEQRGLYGALVFHPEEELVKTDEDQVLVFSDWTDENPHRVLRNLKRDDDYYALKKDKVQSWDQVLSQGMQAVKNRLNANLARMGPMDLSDVGYDAFLVNGKKQIELGNTGQGARVRLRLVNASASSYLNIRFAGGPMQIIAADGVDVEPLLVNELNIALAETYDVIVSPPDNYQYELRASSTDGSGYSSTWIGSSAGTEQRIYSGDYEPPNPYLMDHNAHRMDTSEDHSDQAMDHSMHVATGRETSPKSQPQKSLGHYKNLRALVPVPEADRPVRDLLLRLTGSMDGYRWSFDDVPLSRADRILISRGERVRFILQNETMMNHPIHLHGHFFRVLTDQGEYSPIKHTVNVPNMQTVVIEFDADAEKDWMFHCHNLYHMKAGMSRVLRYDDYRGDQSLPSTIGKVMSMDNMYWSFADIGLQSNKTEISAWAFNNSHEWVLDAEYDWDDLFELEASFAYRFDRFTQAYAGIDIEREKHLSNVETEALAVAGIRYLLPLMIDSDLRVDDEGDLRVELGSELQLTKRTALEWFWNTDEEHGISWHYEFNKKLALTLSTDSEFDAGAGLEFRF